MIQGVYEWVENLDQIFEEYEYYYSRADSQIRSGDKFTLTSTWTNDILEVFSMLEEKKTVKK